MTDEVSKFVDIVYRCISLCSVVVRKVVICTSVYGCIVIVICQ